MPLNKAQLEAINFDKGPAIVLAGPGSGKTTVITCRIKSLVEEKGVEPSRILVITFTRAAADEMKQRYEAMSKSVREPVCFGTFHSIFFHILRHAYPRNASQVIRPEHKREIIRQLLREESDGTNDEAELISSVLSEISSVKGNGGTLKGYESQSCPNELFFKLFKGYNESDLTELAPALINIFALVFSRDENMEYVDSLTMYEVLELYKAITERKEGEA